MYIWMYSWLCLLHYVFYQCFFNKSIWLLAPIVIASVIKHMYSAILMVIVLSGLFLLPQKLPDYSINKIIRFDNPTIKWSLISQGIERCGRGTRKCMQMGAEFKCVKRLEKTWILHQRLNIMRSKHYKNETYAQMNCPQYDL